MGVLRSPRCEFILNSSLHNNSKFIKEALGYNLSWTCTAPDGLGKIRLGQKHLGFLGIFLLNLVVHMLVAEDCEF